MGIPLAVLRGERAPGEKWLPEDALLQMALEVHERGVHKRCGQHLIFSTDDDARGRYPVKSGTCHACAALDAAEKRAGKAEPKPGLIQYVAPDKALRHAIEYPNPEQSGHY